MGLWLGLGGDHTPFSPLPSIIEYIEGLLEKDRRDNRNIGAHGASHILGRVPGGDPVTLLTHCNTGTLATAGYGTALGMRAPGGHWGAQSPRFPPGALWGSPLS